MGDPVRTAGYSLSVYDPCHLSGRIVIESMSLFAGYRQLDVRTAFFYGVTGITPAMAMRMTGIGSQYVFATVDANKNYFDGAKTYKVTLPKGIPEANFWSLTLYDNQRLQRQQ